MPVSALMALLIMLQPDFGTTVTSAIVLMAVLYFAGAPLWLFAVVGAGGAAAMAYLLISAPYRMARLQALLDPEKFPDSSYQLRQALYGMGNGGWFGVGLGQSRAKWSWLPNADSDFIFAIIGEELGLIGAILVLILFGLLAYTGMRIARRNVDPFVKIVAGSATVWLVCQAAINIGYVVGLLPTTGLTLPMISAGGTSLVITMIVFGLLANFARREPQAAAALAARGPGTLLRFLGIGAVRADREIEPAKKAAKREAKQRKQAAKQAARTSKAKAAAAQRAAVQQQKRSRPTAAGAAAGPRRPTAPSDRQPSRRDGRACRDLTGAPPAPGGRRRVGAPGPGRRRQPVARVLQSPDRQHPIRQSPSRPNPARDNRPADPTRQNPARQGPAQQNRSGQSPSAPNPVRQGPRPEDPTTAAGRSGRRRRPAPTSRPRRYPPRWGRPVSSLPTGVSVLLAGGGTAGHIEPALAVADALREADPSIDHHRVGHRARAGDQAGPGPRLRTAAGAGGPAAPQAVVRPRAAARPAAGRGQGHPGGAGGPLGAMW